MSYADALGLTQAQLSETGSKLDGVTDPAVYLEIDQHGAVKWDQA